MILISNIVLKLLMLLGAMILLKLVFCRNVGIGMAICCMM